MTTRYTRNRIGTVIHRESCRAQGIVTSPWRYADGFDHQMIRAEIAKYSWLKACQRCRPDLPATTPTGPPTDRIIVDDVPSDILEARPPVPETSPKQPS